MTQQKLAEMIDKSVGYIGQIERGKTFPSYQCFIKILGALRTTEHEFFAIYTTDEQKDEWSKAINNGNMSKDTLRYLRKSAMLILEVLRDD